MRDEVWRSNKMELPMTSENAKMRRWQTMTNFRSLCCEVGGCTIEGQRQSPQTGQSPGHVWSNWASQGWRMLQGSARNAEGWIMKGIQCGVWTLNQSLVQRELHNASQCSVSFVICFLQEVIASESLIQASRERRATHRISRNQKCQCKIPQIESDLPDWQRFLARPFSQLGDLIVTMRESTLQLRLRLTRCEDF